jgi:Skp family chaperone for outer membrane proteins
MARRYMVVFSHLGVSSLKKNSVILTAVLYGVAAGVLAHAQAPAAGAYPTKIAMVNFSEALARTKEGQKAGGEMNAKFSPRKVEYDKRQAEIAALTDRLNKGRATLSEDAQKQLTNEIQSKTTSWKRYGEDSQAEMDADEAKISQELQAKMGPILQQYAIQNNFAMVFDMGAQQSPVLWFATATNITDALVALYDQAHPMSDAPSAAAPAKPAAAPKPPAPAAPPKKQ